MNKKRFLLSFLFLLTVAVIIGGTQYSKGAQAKNITKAEQKIEEVEKTKELVDRLFKDEKKEELATDVTEDKLKEVAKLVSKQVKSLPANFINEQLIKDIDTAFIFYKTQVKVDSLLNEKILADDVSKQQLGEAKKALNKIESLSLPLYKKLNQKFTEATLQFDYNTETIKALLALFEKKDKKLVKTTITREQYESVQKKIEAIKNEKLKKEQEEWLKLVEEKLNEKEEKLLEEEKIRAEDNLEKEAEENEQNNVEENGIESNTHISSEDGQELWESESSQPVKPWKPTKQWKPSENQNPIKEVKPDSKPDSKPDQTPSPKPEAKPDVKPVPIPKPDENPDNEPEPPKEPEPSEVKPDSDTGSDSFSN